MKECSLNIKRSSENEKRLILEHQIEIFVQCVLDLAEKEGKLDYINISICNHNGNLQTDYTLRDRRKAY